MRSWKEDHLRARRTELSAIGVALLATMTACDSGSDAPSATTDAPMETSDTMFVSWDQGFEENTAGWYDAETPDALGWCGSISQVTQDSSPIDAAPSAGEAYAVVRSGPCNDFWSAAEVLFGVPYAPGTDLALALNPWPESGYVSELDIYLDPAWSGVYRGNFEFAGVPGSTLIQFGATILESSYALGDVHTGPHYFVDVEAVAGDPALEVGDYTVSAPGWYTFRFSFADNDGEVRVDFELLDSAGATVATIDSIAPTDLNGPVRVAFNDPVPTANYATGWLWFLDVAAGLALPIDEHTQRPGS